MPHPVGTHISKEQAHELKYWLEKHDFSTSTDNQELLKELIDQAKNDLSLKQSDHLLHKELDEYFKKNKKVWAFAPPKKE